MQLRKAIPAMALAFLVIAATPASDAASSRYRFEINTLSVTDLTELGQGEMESSAELEGVLSVDIDEASNTATVVLDTMDGVAEGQGQQVTPAMLAAAIGTSWSGTVDEKGRLQEMATESTSPLASQLEGNLLRGLFPYIPAGASSGDTWADTLEFSDSNDQGTQETVTIMSYTAKGDTTVNGMQAMIVTSVIEATTTIFQEAQGGLDIEGASTGTGIHFVGSDGRYLGGTRSAVTELEVSGPAIPAVIPVTAETELVVELLP